MLTLDLMKPVTDKQKIEEVLTRGVENIYPSKDFLEKALLSGKKLKIYVGVDPTGPNLHLGHAIPIGKLAQFQKLGHEVILLIGDFTGMIGDPTDKTATRVQLTKKQVLANCKNYQKQVKNILNFEKGNKAGLKFNSKWLGKMSFEDVVELSAHFTVQQMLERDMFKERMKNEKPIGLHEFLYPLMQGYDSVAMDVDMEIGGNDQTFNMMAGRTLMKAVNNKEKFVLTTKLLVDPTGKKMGKTEGNMITLSDSAQDMYGKIMSWPDELIFRGFEICTNVPMAEVAEMEGKMKLGANPKDAKMRLAREVVKTHKGEKEAQKAEEYFVHTFSKRETPEDMPEIKAKVGELLSDVLVNNKIVASKSEFRRLVDGGAVDINETGLKDYHYEIAATLTAKIGKKKFVKIIVK